MQGVVVDYTEEVGIIYDLEPPKVYV
jgi:hypothetical protein